MDFDREDIDDQIADAIYKAVENGAEFINMSLGFVKEDELNLVLKGGLGRDIPERVLAAIEYGAENGVGFFIAAGNSRDPEHGNYRIELGSMKYKNLYKFSQRAQNSLRFIIATNYQNNNGKIEEKLADFTDVLADNYTNLSLSVPGVDILSYSHDWEETVDSGTSFAAPIATAVAAALKTITGLSAPQIIEIMSGSARKQKLDSESLDDYERKNVERLTNLYKNLEIQHNNKLAQMRKYKVKSQQTQKMLTFNQFIESQYKKETKIESRLGNGILDWLAIQVSVENFNKK